MQQAWIIVANPSNMEQVARLGVFGLNTKGVLAKAVPGDGVVAYVKGEKAVAGLGVVTKAHYLDDEPLFDGGLFADRIGVALDLHPRERWVDVWSVIDDLAFPSDKFNWWASLAGGVRRIDIPDFEVFRQKFLAPKA